MTHRSSSLDKAKLEYINKRHLMRTWSTPEGLKNLAEKAHEEIKERFPSRYYSGILPLIAVPFLKSWFFSPYTSIDLVKDAILLLEVSGDSSLSLSLSLSLSRPEKILNYVVRGASRTFSIFRFMRRGFSQTQT